MPNVDTLVTGGAGFVGLAVVEQLLQSGESVVVLDRIAPPEEFVNLARTLPGRLSCELADIRSRDEVERCLTRHDPRAVIHGAAVTSDAAREGRTPDLVVQTNLAGTLNLLEILRRGPRRRFVHLSTSGVYGDIAHRPGFDAATVEETVLAEPKTLYAISKAAAEQVVLRYADLFGLDAVCARIGICWGPWEYDTGLRDPFSVPLQLLRVASAGGSASLTRDPTKDWAYSRDVGRAVAALKNAGSTPSRVYNVGADEIWPASSWAERLRAAFPDFDYRIGEPAGPAPIEVYGPKDRPPLDVGRLKTELGFSFHYASEAAFADYLDWASGFRCWRLGGGA